MEGERIQKEMFLCPVAGSQGVQQSIRWPGRQTLSAGFFCIELVTLD